MYDASHPKGKYTLGIFGEQDIDALCSGNHELYHNSSSNHEYAVTVPNFKGNYLASNLDIIDPETGEQGPLAQRYKKFTTKNQGIRIMSFGFLFDFTGNSNNTIVQKVEDTIKERWFQEAIRDREVDLFLVIGHVALRSPEFKAIFRVIRGQNWDTPIQFFGGHTHIRDYAKYDSKAYSMESGRYMETIGFMSIDGLGTDGKSSSRSSAFPFFYNSRSPRTLTASPKFGRRYIDNNLYSFYHHTGLNSTTFPTRHGLNISHQIADDRKALNLDLKYGCAPHDYWTNRAPFPGKDSIFSWLQDEVLPDMVRDKMRGDVPRLVLTNSGALRFDLFEGAFTVDTMYTVSPFTSGFRYIKDVPLSVAKRLLMILNQEVPQLWDASHTMAFKSPALVVKADFEASHDDYSTNALGAQRPLINVKPENDLLPGYTTTDDAGSDGDDTIHAPIKFYSVPNCLESRIGFPQTSREGSEPESVDLVYVDFIERYIVLALQFLGTDYSTADTGVYMKGTTLTDVIRRWVRDHWKC